MKVVHLFIFWIFDVLQPFHHCLHLCLVFAEFFDVAIFIDALPWIWLYYNNLLHLQVLLFEHENDTKKIKVE
jgi:hypothetical protein